MKNFAMRAIESFFVCEKKELAIVERELISCVDTNAWTSHRVVNASDNFFRFFRT
jgi:hypothetical protein